MRAWRKNLYAPRMLIFLAAADAFIKSLSRQQSIDLIERSFDSE